MTNQNNITAIIAATDSSYGIGKNNSIPWKHKIDMEFFKNTTQYGICIMGKNTYESIEAYAPNRKRALLPNRISIVVSTTRIPTIYPAFGINVGATHFVNSIENAYSLAVMFKYYKHYFNYNLPNIFFLGGVNIFKAAVPYINKIYLNTLQSDYNCDTFFPKDILNNFRHEKSISLADDLISNEFCISDEFEGY